MRAGILLLASLFAVSAAQAGVAPALGGNKMTSSGAKIAAPAKPEENKEGKNTESENKEQQNKH